MSKFERLERRLTDAEIVAQILRDAWKKWVSQELAAKASFTYSKACKAGGCRGGTVVHVSSPSMHLGV